MPLPPSGSLSSQEQQQLYQQIVEYSFETTVIHANREILYINQSGADFFKAPAASIIGADVASVFLPSFQSYICERIRLAEEIGKIGELLESQVTVFDGTIRDVELYCHPVEFGERKAVQSILRDITVRKERERSLEKQIYELAAPIVPVKDAVAILPLVGIFDSARIEHLTHTLPESVQSLLLRHLIVDVSGLFDFTEIFVKFLYQLQAVMKLLGVSTIFTGLRPELAQKAVRLCGTANLLTTMKDVKQAVAFLQ